jgi:hypothetical protein
MRWIVLLLLAGCASLPAGARQVPPERYRAALAAWAAHGLPEGSCAGAAARTYEVVQADVRELCRSTAHGCQVGRSVGLLGMGGGRVLLVQRADRAGPALAAHELVHWLAKCSGISPGWGDAGHGRPELWAPGGVEPRVAEALSAPP